MAFSIVHRDKTYQIDEVGDNFEDWTVVKQESYKLSKEKIIVDKFNEEFKFIVKDYKELTNACSRSKAFTEWLINANIAYSEEAELPLFIKDVIEPEHFSKLQTELTLINRKIADYSIRKRDLAERYKSDLKELQIKEEQETSKMKQKDKLLEVLSLNSQYLPFTLQLQIERYTPKDEENSQESREVYARECLIKYKRALCQIVVDNPSVDITEVINSNMLK